MLRILALATLTVATVPQPSWVSSRPAPQSADTPPVVKAKTLEMDLARARLEAFDQLSKLRREGRADLIERQSALRSLRRSMEDRLSRYDREIERLQTRVDRADSQLAEARTPDPDHAAAHSIRAAYEQLERAKERANEALEEAVKDKIQLLMRAEEDVVALEQEIAQIEASLENGEQRMLLQQEFLRTEKELALAQSNLPAPSAPPLVEDDFRAARIAAAVAGKPLLVNFSAHTCVNCRMMEVEVFQSPEVSGVLGQFVEARLHSDARDAALRGDIEKRAKALVGSNAVPAYVALDPRTGKQLGRFMGTSNDKVAFTGFLSDSLKALGGAPPAATDAELWGRIFELEEQVTYLQENVKKMAGSNW